MGAEYHVTGTVDDAVVWICGDIIQYEMNRLFSHNGGFRLASCYGTECNKEFVIHCTGVVEQGAYNFLNAVLAFVI